MTVQELQQRYPDFAIVVTVFDEDHNGDYLYDDNLELGNYPVKYITAMDEGCWPTIRCNC